MEKQQEYRIDERNQEEILKQAGELAHSYIPQWSFDKKNPDIGMVLGILFSQQMEWNIRQFNNMPERFQKELVTMLGLSLLPVKPAEALVLLEGSSLLDKGLYIPKGTRFLAEGQQISFENTHDVYITESRLTHVLEVHKESGKIIPIKGSFPFQEYQKSAEQTEHIPDKIPFALFEESKEGIEKNALLLYHRTFLQYMEDRLFLRFKGSSLVKLTTEGKYKFSYLTKEGKLPAAVQAVRENMLEIRPEETQGLKTETVQAILAEPSAPVKEPVYLEDIWLLASGERHTAAYIGSLEQEKYGEEIPVFGEVLTLYSVCYLGDEKYFSKGGAKITIEFCVGCKVHFEGRLPKEEELKLIKRKPQAAFQMQPEDTYAQQIVLEYFNGVGWKPLADTRQYADLFDGRRKGKQTVEFICPRDWEAIQAGPYEGRCLRLRIEKAENCYMQPCRHHYPVITMPVISYSYEDIYERPEKAEVLYGTKRQDITRLLGEKKTLIFAQPDIARDMLYLGFDKKIEAGPVNLYMEVTDIDGGSADAYSFEYSSLKGFKPLKVIDKTDGLQHTGILRFMPPEDFKAREIQGVTCFWLRIHGKQPDKGQNPPVIRHLHLNCTSVLNVETGKEEEFYIRQSVPYMEFSLGSGAIWKAEVWVNEKEHFSKASMEQLLRENKGQYRAVYDFRGEIRAFYVLWTEVENFMESGVQDRHYRLDRSRHKLCFGDGVHVQIPGASDQAALLVKVKYSKGEEGNIEPYKITSFASLKNFRGKIYNPIGAFGGGNTETAAGVFKRGENRLSSRERLVSKADYRKAALAFSDQIVQAACIVEDTITLVLLMKDFGTGGHSFAGCRAGLLEYFYRGCEVTVSRDQLEIIPPIAVDISVEVWVYPAREEDAFILEETLQKELESLLDPVKAGRKSGFEIGTLPSSQQIKIRLLAAAQESRIEHLSVTGRYPENGEIRERELERIVPQPMFICRSGKHKIHIVTKESGYGRR